MDMLSVSYFVATAENLSFTAAARNLYVSQPTISKKIAELEAELGLPLFSRTGKTIQMTAAGKELYYDFKTLQTFFNEIVTHANDIKNSITGSIHIGIPSHMDLGRSIPGFFNAFYRQNPGIKVTLLYDTRQNLINGFFDGSMDCVFFLSFDAERFHDELNVCRFILPSAPHRLLYSPALFPDNPPQSVEAFRNQTFLFYRENHTDYSVSGKSHELLSDFGSRRVYCGWTR
jgi:DNA-binding transcriptional LysR family regulator